MNLRSLALGFGMVHIVGLYYFSTNGLSILKLRLLELIDWLTLRLCSGYLTCEAALRTPSIVF